MKEIKYTRHAREKFVVFERHGFEVTGEQVKAAIRNPDQVFSQSGGRFIAQKGITERHVLRVVYRKEEDEYIVITFYPGRRERYESNL